MSSRDLENNSILADTIEDQLKEIKSLKEKQKLFKKELKRAYNDTHKEYLKRIFDRIWIAPAIGITALAILAIIIIPIYMNLTTPDVISHCYTHSYCDLTGSGFKLYGSVDWHEDRELGRYESLEKAVEASRLMGCKLEEFEPQQ